jgi:ABC-2 type transport system ATP-binding protein
MSKRFPAIRAKDLGIKFYLRGEANPTVHSGMVRFLKGKPARREFWAIRNVTLDIPPGEVFGIIGANGSGKSTLLRSLARIYFPDEGELEIRGKISSLITLGAGFRPELSGMDNIYYNGIILGLTKQEIERKRSQIIEFADLGQFINEPVRTYSSGMRARLGFSVAVHVDPEILVVDEVLVVGDAAFRARCAEKMREMFMRGATVVMVQHNMDVIVEMCQRVMWLEKGHVQTIGEPLDVVNRYLTSRNLPALEEKPPAPNSGRISGG